MVRRAISLAIVFMAGSTLLLTARAQTKDSLNAAEQAVALSGVREYALNDARNLPMYTCTERTRQTIAVRTSVLEKATWTEWREDNCGSEQNSLFAAQEAVALAPRPSAPNRGTARLSGGETYGVVPEGRDPLPGMLVPGEFGRLLGVIFDPDTGADISWKSAATLDGRKVHVFAFRVPQSRGYSLVESKRTIRVPFKGLVYADSQTGEVVRLEMICTDIPKGSEYTGADLLLEYKPATVAGMEFILPYHSVANFHMLQGEATNDAEYTSYHRFIAASTFQAESVDSTDLDSPPEASAPEGPSIR